MESIEIILYVISILHAVSQLQLTRSRKKNMQSKVYKSFF